MGKRNCFSASFTIRRCLKLERQGPKRDAAEVHGHACAEFPCNFNVATRYSGFMEVINMVDLSKVLLLTMTRG